MNNDVKNAEIKLVQETICNLISNHLDLISKVNELSEKCLQAARDKDVDNVVFIIDNRERLINIVEKFQTQIEDMLNTANKTIIDDRMAEIISTWAKEITKWVEVTNLTDSETMTFLSGQKEETTKELATIYKGKVGMKGYNLSSVKK